MWISEYSVCLSYIALWNRPNICTRNFISLIPTTIIVPVLNEVPNIIPLIKGIASNLEGSNYRILIVDDYSIGSSQTKEIISMISSIIPVSGIFRSKYQSPSLSSSVLEGMATVSNGIIAVMDGDLQHDPADLPNLISAVHEGADVAIGSRNSSLDSMNILRKIISQGATLLSRPLSVVKDPMSGYFACKAINVSLLCPRGFKILLEILVKTKSQKVVEIPIKFGKRIHGVSKLSITQAIQYALHVLDLYTWKIKTLIY